MYAVIETGGKQYKVSEGDVIFIEKLEAAEGEAVTFDKVLVVADGEKVNVGAPVVAGASVTAKVEKQGKAKKIYVFKMKRKKNYRRKKGHRQPFTKVEISKFPAFNITIPITQPHTPANILMNRSVGSTVDKNPWKISITPEITV